MLLAFRLADTVVECAQEGLDHRVLAVTSGYEHVVSTVQSVLRGLESCPGWFHVASVIAVVNARNFFLGSSLTTTIPGLLEQCLAGFVDTIWFIPDNTSHEVRWHSCVRSFWSEFLRSCAACPRGDGAGAIGEPNSHRHFGECLRAFMCGRPLCSSWLL